MIAGQQDLVGKTVDERLFPKWVERTGKIEGEIDLTFRRVDFYIFASYKVMCVLLQNLFLHYYLVAGFDFLVLLV